MRSLVARLSDDGARYLRSRVGALFAVLILCNAAAWCWALLAFQNRPALLGTALLAYTLGLRHAVDADHIAAIDNVTRKLMQEGRRPVGVGLFFSLGHSTIVVLASVAIALAATSFKARLPGFHATGGVVGTILSALFLFAIALMNLLVLRQVWSAFRHARTGAVAEESIDTVLGGGPLARLFRPLYRTVRHSWHMYPVGFLFGLGFDTATEVGLLGIAAAEASRGLSMWSILVFPALFTAGMSLVDSIDSILMLGAYGWAFVKPLRKLYYNVTITLVSVIIAILVGGIEVLGLLADQLDLKGGFWDAIGTMNDNSGRIGVFIIGVFITSWFVSLAIYRLRGYDRITVRAPS